MKLEINFVLDRDTKNTIRYIEHADAPKIGTLYIQKLAFPDSSKPPNALRVTVTDEPAAKAKPTVVKAKATRAPVKRSRRR